MKIALRVLVLIFVFVGGAITFAGPHANMLRSLPAAGSTPADMLNGTSQEASVTEQSSDDANSLDMG